MARRSIAPALLFLLTLAAAAMALTREPGAKQHPRDVAPKLPAIQGAANKLRPLHKTLGTPQPGDWLASHSEAGQTFEQYRARRPGRGDARLTTLYIQPLGDFNPAQQRLLDATRYLLGRFYNAPVKTLDPIALATIPDKARRVHPTWGVSQILTGYVMNDVLIPRQPKDAVAVLALTTSDLWPGEGWNFVFGEASLNERVGVWSINRFGDPAKGDADYALCLRRTLKVAVHETGHMFGIEHCTAYECCMNGSNNLAETDRQPLAFCPECAAKIWWTCRVEPAQWYAALHEFAKLHKLDIEVASFKQSADALAK